MEKVKLCDLQSVLRRKLAEKLIVVNCVTKLLISKGENFYGVILDARITIKNDDSGEMNTLYLISKIPPVTNSESIVDNFLLFKKEVFFYEKIRTVYEELLLKYGFEDNGIFNIFPKFYGSRFSLRANFDFNNGAFILMENLKKKGYYLADKIIGI